MLTEINESGAIAKIRDNFLLNANNFLLNANLTYPILLLYELKMFFQIFVSKIYRPVILKTNSL